MSWDSRLTGIGLPPASSTRWIEPPRGRRCGSVRAHTFSAWCEHGFRDDHFCPLVGFGDSGFGCGFGFGCPPLAMHESPFPKVRAVESTHQRYAKLD